eukprot:TRINITY_DN22963_c0_g2_i1.p1 TRINITY_DN22963_c0_g2~~TRINITY_DN22963_c0_g2_i1.p1  ORF type:complete len:1119 (-),score=129.83 TRINITY_DN22963_c0_g2_i1:101-3127(-)
MPGATNMFHRLATSSPYCARKRKSSSASDDLGDAPLKINWPRPILRIGFYIIAEGTVNIMCTHPDGTYRDFSVQGLKIASSSAHFFSAYGNGISSVTVSGDAYCIDDLRWQSESDLITKGLVDFAEAVTRPQRGSSNLLDAMVFTAPNGIEYTVSGWSRTAGIVNGFMCELEHPCAESMRIDAQGLTPNMPYTVVSWNFHALNCNGCNPRFYVQASGAAPVAAVVRRCAFPGIEGNYTNKPKEWLPLCGRAATFIVFADQWGKIVVTWKAASERIGNLSLSGFSISKSLDVSATTTSTASVGIKVDEVKCGQFVVEGWSRRKAETVKDEQGSYRIHGPFRDRTVVKSFSGLPPHDTIAMTMRLWTIGKWKRPEELVIKINGEEVWKKMKMPGSTCGPAWKPLGTKWAVNFGGAPRCYTDVGVGLRDSSTLMTLQVGKEGGSERTKSKYGFGRLKMVLGSTTAQLENEQRNFSDLWSDPARTRLGHAHYMHGPFSAATRVTKEFRRIPYHQFLRVSVNYYSFGEWRGKIPPVSVDFDGVIEVDGIEVWRKKRHSPKGCYGPPSQPRNLRWSIVYDPALTKLPATLGRKVCRRRVDVAIPHAKRTVTVTISMWDETNRERAEFGFSDFRLEIGGEVERCTQSLCRQGWAIKDGPPWCSGSCTIAACCDMLGTCTANLCDRQAGWALKSFGIPSFCRSELCVTTECCQKMGHCAKELCGFGYKMKDFAPAFCEREICTSQECCERRDVCTISVCPSGYALFDRYVICAGTKCSMFECCRMLVKCTGAVCQVPGLKLKESLPEWCSSDKCKPQECCVKLGVCNVDVCPRGARVKNGPELPSFCDGETCVKEECCNWFGSCDEFDCPLGWGSNRDRAEICSLRECTPQECCKRLGNCSSELCPVGSIRKANAAQVCKDIYCEIIGECCDVVNQAQNGALSEVSLLEDMVSDSMPISLADLSLLGGGPSWIFLLLLLGLVALGGTWWLPSILADDRGASSGRQRKRSCCRFLAR